MFVFNIVPLVSVNGVPFGATREEVHACFGEGISFQKSKYSKNSTENYGYCHIFFDEKNCMEAVEIFDSACVYINNEIVFPLEKKRITSAIEKLEKDEYGFINKDNSIAIYAPNEKVESILFGKLHYYK